jgi:hypothetical protein
MTTTAPAMTTLTPLELADLLGVDRADAGLLATGQVRVSAAFVESWTNRVGPLELSLKEVSLITGIPGRTLADWCKAKTLIARRVIGPGRGYRVAPSHLIESLRAKNDGPVPPVGETPLRQQKRARDAKQRLLAACGGRA